FNRSVTPSDRHGLLGSYAQQGTGVGLVERSILACADAGDFFRCGSDRADLLGVTSPQPRGQFPAIAEGNFSACCLIIFCAFMVLYAASTSLPGLLQSLFGYDALNAGLVMSPAGFFAVAAMPVVGFLLGRGTDARWMIATGLLIMAAGNYWMSQLNLEI